MRRFAQWAGLLGIVAGGLAAVPGHAAADAAGSLGPITGVHQDGATFTLDAGKAKVRLVFLRDDVFRLWTAPDGTFTDPANSPPSKPGDPAANIVVKTDYPQPRTWLRRDGASYRIGTGKITVEVRRNPALFSVRRADGSLVWAETKPLSWDGKSTTQTLAERPGEQFVGGGEQNGSFSHRGKTVQVGVDYNWDEGGHPNSVPYYASTSGYGVLRDTFAPGSYAFTDPVVATHAENRFDAFYFVAPKKNDLKTPIDRYTELTGRPFMPPMYGLELGDSDCYLHNANRGERHTLDALNVADGYKKAGMPNGWMLVNDGYGCGYENLKETAQGLQGRDMQLGLWTENGLSKLADQVKAGQRVAKLDVAWVGDGYRFALSGCQDAYNGIQANSDARGFTWAPESWAGAQRCGVQWSGDQSGAYEYSRWQVPTYQGATLSGLAYTTGDVDGIFRGGPNTYTRDLQWKAFLPAAMTMDGWAPSDKQPWRYGEPYTSINRKYLLLRERLMPYAYTFAAEAHRTGVGATRPLALEYPTDPQAWKAGQEFLSGTDFLVAPVTADASSRDGIYLPKGTWTDYWTGRTYRGPVTLDHYSAPLDTLPLFVRAGAIVPMWPQGTLSWQTRDTSHLGLDVFPQGHSSFTAYEDDGATRQFEKGSYATQTYTVDAPHSGRGDVRVRIDAPKGSYAGMPTARAYDLTVHTGSRPKAVLVNGKAVSGWSYADGVVSVSTSGPSTVTLRDASAVGGLHPEDAAVEASLGTEPVVAPGGGGADVPVTLKGHAPAAKITLDAPSGWTVTRRGDRTFHVQAPANATPKAYDLTANVTYKAHGTTYTVRARGQAHVPYASLAAAYNNVGITDDSATKPGDFDGYKRSFSAQALSAAGITPGGQVKALGATFTWPSSTGTPNNVRPDGQTVPLTGTGSALAFLGSGAGPDLGGVTLHYTDGTSERRYFGFPHWGSASGLGATQVAKLPYRNNQAGKDNTPVYLFANEVPLAAGKKLIAVTLPTTTSTHLFSLALK